MTMEWLRTKLSFEVLRARAKVSPVLCHVRGSKKTWYNYKKDEVKSSQDFGLTYSVTLSAVEAGL